MYNNFFDFKEKPFGLDPNPDFLFMSKNHGEALAHLIFEVSHGKGFVGIAGEDGTGKTTLCRAFLGNLEESTKAAYILNPELDNTIQLFKAIYDKLGIYSAPDNTKDIIDILKKFLIEKKTAGKNFLLFIDEAQNLPQEVLEQFLLLIHEITEEKLLQTILVGQPELGDKLSSGQIKQLGQSITINCQLRPLSLEETIDYIRHRISYAAHRSCPPFDKASCRAIYEYSKGIPRLINIACDMALLQASKSKSFKITGAITREAIDELTRKEVPDKPSERPKKTPILAILSAVLVCAIIVLLYFTNKQSPEVSVMNTPVTNTDVLTSPAPIKPEADTQEQPAKLPADDPRGTDDKISEIDMDAHLVYVGNFATSYQAKWRLKNLQSLGFQSFIHTKTNNEGKSVYMVFAGKYQTNTLAEEASKLLKEKGHSNSVAMAKEFLDEGQAK